MGRIGFIGRVQFTRSTQTGAWSLASAFPCTSLSTPAAFGVVRSRRAFLVARVIVALRFRCLSRGERYPTSAESGRPCWRRWQHSGGPSPGCSVFRVASHRPGRSAPSRRIFRLALDSRGHPSPRRLRAPVMQWSMRWSMRPHRSEMRACPTPYHNGG